MAKTSMEEESALSSRGAAAVVAAGVTLETGTGVSAAGGWDLTSLRIGIINFRKIFTQFKNQSLHFISLSSPLAPGLATELWSKTFPRPHLGRFYFLVRLLGRSLISLVSGSQGLHEASRRGDLHKLPPGTNSHVTDQHRTKICRAAVARELLSLDREATWNMLWTSWMGPSLVGGGSGFMRKARAGAGRGPGLGENYGFY